MKYARFQATIKPIMLVVVIVVLIVTFVLIATMLSNSYVDDVVHGIVKSTNGSFVTLESGETFETVANNISPYCNVGDKIKVKRDYINSVWCDDNFYSINVLVDLDCNENC